VDFSYSEEQQMLQESVQKFVMQKYDFYTRGDIIKTEAGYSAENWAMFAELGWLTVPFTEEDGGFGGKAVDLMVMMEEFGKGMLVEPYLSCAIMGGTLIADLGNEEQKGALIPQIMEGAMITAVAYAEQGSRFNSNNVTTSAVASGDDVVLNGAKTAVLGAPNAQTIIVSARESGAATDADGISLFLVDANAAGVSIKAYTTIDGRKAGEVTLTDVRVPATARLGAAGGAAAVLGAVIDRATLAVAAEAVGAMDSLLTKTVEYSKTRKQFGTAIGTFQALQHRMADMFIQCQLARSIVVRAAMILDSDEDAVSKARAVSSAKSRVGKAIRKVGQEAVQIHGGIGVTDELDVGHLFKRVTALDLMFGNAEYHLQRFASL
jgi:alkylation response protein AidB-like acyl-CoA dehydrogenase